MGPRMISVASLDPIGVVLFAATGALAASRKELDLMGFIFLATVTGIGGGTVRDLILGVPVFWVEDPLPVILCAGTAVVVYFSAHLIEYRYRWLLWCDAVALAAYGVLGAVKGEAETGSAVIAVVMAALTGSFGGILRDVLANEPSVLLRREIYVTAPVLGGVVFVAATAAGAPQWGAVAAGVAVAFGIRAGAIGLGWSLPVYRSRPGRPVGRADGRPEGR